MFEKEIQFITDFNLNKIKKLGSFFTLDDLTKAKVHPAIVQYLSAEIDYLIFLDRQSLLQKSVFDYSGPEIVKHFLAISQEIKKNKLLPFEEVKKIVQQAVTFQLTYLLRPVWTLKKFIFDTTEVRSQEEVKLFFNYTYFYDYYKKIFLTILEKKQLLTVSIYEFEVLLEKIQGQLLEQQMKNVIDNALIDTAEFLNTGEVSKTKLSIETLEIFLKDRGLHNQIFKIRKLLSADAKQKFELSEIQAALSSNISVTDYEKPQVEKPMDKTQLDIFEPAEAVLDEDKSDTNALLSSNASPEFGELETDEVDIEKPDFDEGEEDNSLDEPEEYFERNNGESEISEIETGISSGEDDLHAEEELLVGEEELEDEDIQGLGFLKPKTDELPPVSSRTDSEKEGVSFEKYFKEELEKSQTSFEEDADFESEEPPQPVDEPKDKEHEEPEERSEEHEVDIFSYFSTKETMKIIGAIFNQDSLDFVNTLERITECSNKDEANQILKDVFLSYRVNSVGKEATMLKGKIVQYFRDKEF